MKKIVTLFLIIIAIVVSRQMVFTNASTPPAARTGAPGESTCSGCHGGASGTGGTIDFGGSLSEYELSKTYTVTINGENGPLNGFELVALRNSDNTNIGTITITNTANTTTQLSGGKTYISHKNASTNNTWSFDWTAPSANEGNITFYFAINKADGVSGSGGADLIYTNSLTITPNVVPPCSTDMFIVSTSKTDVLCNGNADGTASVSISGGTQPYSYKWSNSETSQIIANLFAGNYFVTVSDANGCDTISSATLNEPSAIAVKTVASSDASCGNNDGKISVSAFGGTPGYLYNWEIGIQDSTVTGLAAGSYDLTISDAQGCKWIKSYNVSDAGAPGVFIMEKISISCSGYNDGSITVSVDGGITPYTYLWSDANSQTTLTATGLVADIYNFEVTDSSGCKSIIAITLTSPDKINININNLQNISCNGLSDGSITVSADGGIAPYAYLWSDVDSQTTVSATGLFADVYTIEITDSSGCKNIDSITITEPDKLIVTIENKQNITCYGDNDGAVDISVSGGTVPYSYLWSDGSTTQDLSLLPPDKYGVTVTDANGCVDSNKVTISEPDSLIIELFLVKLLKSLTPDSFYGGFAVVTGGVTPYQYYWSTGDTTDTLYTYVNGLIVLTVTDANGCIKYKSDSILESIENISKKEIINYYPNPTSGIVYIYGLNTNELLKVNIFDILGNKFKKEMQINNNHNFDLNEFNIPPGLYFIELETKEGIIRKKIIFTK